MDGGPKRTKKKNFPFKNVNVYVLTGPKAMFVEIIFCTCMCVIKMGKFVTIAAIKCKSFIKLVPRT